MAKSLSSKSLTSDDEEGNAYASSDDDWTLPGHQKQQQQQDRESLSDSIRQHAANMNLAEDGDISLDDDKPAARPLGDISSSASHRSSRSYSNLKTGSVSRGGGGGGGFGGGSSPPTSRPSMMSSSTVTTTTSSAPRRNSKEKIKPPSVLRKSRRYSPVVPRDSSPSPFKTQTNKPRSTGTKLRACIALVCLILAILFAIFVSHGAPGRWITSGLIGTIPGSTAIKEPPKTGGIPGAIGSTPAYNGTFDIPNLEGMHLILPDAIENGFADWRIPFPASNRSDLPVFWQLAKSGGNVVQRILGECLGLVEVSNKGAGHSEPTLQILETSLGTRYMNVDATTAAGLQRAVDLSLVQSSLADAMFTPLITQAATIFTPPDRRGRFFSIFRHPIARSMAIYQAAKASDPTVAGMSIAEFGQYRLPNNEMVRTLASKAPNDDLTDDDLFLAMEIVRRKCVVGLVDRMEESMVRFHGYFGWYALLVDGVSKCQSTLLAPADAKVPMPASGTEAYSVMMNQNRLDLRLFDFILYMYDVQGGNTKTQ